MRLRLLLGACAALLLALWAASATADPFAEPPICSSAGTALAGHYGNLTITGNAYVASDTSLVVSGTLRLEPGSCLDAFSLGRVNVGGNVLVGKGAVLALGCTPNALGDPTLPPCFSRTTSDTVDGSIVASQPLTMYLDGDTIHGSVTSSGGDPGVDGPFTNFAIKDNRIDGNLSVESWRGGWSGAVRNQVGGNVVWSRNMSTQDPDSNEVQTNAIRGNLTCRDNSPAAQVNPADGGQPNTVGGQKIGQCSGL